MLIVHNVQSVFLKYSSFTKHFNIVFHIRFFQFIFLNSTQLFKYLSKLSSSLVDVDYLAVKQRDASDHAQIFI